MMGKWRVLIAVWLLAWAGPALAEWHRAESDHFVIYANDRPQDLKRFGEMLEAYHQAMAVVTRIPAEKPSPSARVTVFAMGSASDVQRLIGDKSGFLQGFYIPRAAASVAFVPDLRSTRGEPDAAMNTLLHEYAHHALINAQRLALPRWMNEGAAEFYSSAEFPASGGVTLGRPNARRGYELANVDQVTIEQLLDEAEYAKRKSRGYDSFYGRSWLLFHYLVFSAERKGQLSAYFKELAEAKPRLEAARNAFGDLKALDRDLDKYMRATRMFTWAIKPDMLKPATVTVTPLSAGHAAMMPVILQSRRGVDSETAPRVAAQARAIAARFPDDPEVLAALAEAEYDAQNEPAAIAAADKALAANPGHVNALVQKGYALFRMAETADDRVAAYKAAMVPFQRLNAVENDHPLPLIYYYRSFAQRGEAPSDTARAALERAWVLAPFDQSLAFQAAVMLAMEGKIALARSALQPLAGNPHNSSWAERIRGMLAQLDGQPEGAPLHLTVGPEVEANPDTGGEGSKPQ